MSNEIINVIINLVLQITMIGLIFGLAYKFGWKKFGEYIERRQKATMAVMYEAEGMKEEAILLHDEAEQKMKEINVESSAILARAEESARKIAQDRKEKLDDELKRKRILEEKQLANEHKRLKQKMEVEVIEKATELASEFITSNASKESTEQQIASFLEKIGDE